MVQLVGMPASSMTESMTPGPISVSVEALRPQLVAEPKD